MSNTFVVFFFFLCSLAGRLFPHPLHRQTFVQSLSFLKEMHLMLWIMIGFEEPLDPQYYLLSTTLVLTGESTIGNIGLK